MPRTKTPKTSQPADAPATAMMDTREVAAYLRLKERRVYDLVTQQHAAAHPRDGQAAVPEGADRRVAGGQGNGSASGGCAAAPPIVAGSHDPLLEWAVRDSRCGFAMLACGSSAGLDRLARGQATVAAMHWLDRATGDYNVPLVRERMGARTASSSNGRSAYRDCCSPPAIR